jgi:hypothetical protein
VLKERKRSSKHVAAAEGCSTVAMAGKGSINRALARSGGSCYARERLEVPRPHAYFYWCFFALANARIDRHEH